MEKIKIRLKAFDFRLLDQTCEKIVNIAQTGSKIIGPLVLPNLKQNQNTIYKRMIEIINPSVVVIEKLMQMKMSIGIDIELKQFSK